MSWQCRRPEGFMACSASSFASLQSLEARRLLAVIAPGNLDRPADPVVLTGASVPGLIGVQPAKLVAFRDIGAGWDQVPIQVDERALVDTAQVYNFVSPAVGGMQILAYTDSGTFTGADPNPNIDADDEIVFM